jgi:hypothetical protein
MQPKGKLSKLQAITLLVCLTLLAAAVPAGAQGARIQPTAQLSVNAGAVRTPQQVAQSEILMPQGLVQEPIPFRPTMDMASYIQAKAAAAGDVSLTKPGEPDLPPKLKGKNFNGDSQGSLIPPDTHGAVGLDHFVEIVNSKISIFRKPNGVRVNGGGAGVSLASFFGYFTTTLFDPRVVYDLTWNRWVMTSDAFPESNTVQFHFIAVSTSSDPLGSYCIYAINVHQFTPSGSFWDFPQLGMDQDAIILTANVFQGTTLLGADELSIAKAALYNCRGFFVPVFTGLVATLAPPIVLDNNFKTFLAASPPNSNAIRLYTLTNSSRGFGATLSGPALVPVPAYTVPPNAPQPSPCTGIANLLDTSDNRFANAGTQNGNDLFQVHSEALGAFAANRYYHINTAANTAVSDVFFATASSHDFNPSIAANESGDVFITWSATDPPVGTNAQVRFSGRFRTDAESIPAGSALFTSSTCLTGNFDPNFGHQRWGDYSAVSIDPGNHAQAWIVNEKIDNSSAWGSRWGRIQAVP